MVTRAYIIAARNNSANTIRSSTTREIAIYFNELFDPLSRIFSRGETKERKKRVKKKKKEDIRARCVALRSEYLQLLFRSDTPMTPSLAPAIIIIMIITAGRLCLFASVIIAFLGQKKKGI